MKHLILFVIMFAGFSPCFCETYTIETGQFEKIKVNGNISVVYKNLPDSTGFARYEAPSGSADLFNLENKKGGVLKINPADDQWGKDTLPVIHVYSDFLSSVESYSEKVVQVSKLVPTANFKVTLVGNGTIYVDNIKSMDVSASLATGNGSIYLSGSCENAAFKMVGTGLISADMLSADNVKCHILGTGTIGCWAVDNLKVSGIGSTKIYYKGSPNISKKGGGKLFELPGEQINKQGTEVPSFNQPDDEEE